eukprot:1033874-Pyramimonas_sp.AAC.1
MGQQALGQLRYPASPPTSSDIEDHQGVECLTELLPQGILDTRCPWAQHGDTDRHHHVHGV